MKCYDVKSLHETWNIYIIKICRVWNFIEYDEYLIKYNKNDSDLWLYVVGQ